MPIELATLRKEKIRRCWRKLKLFSTSWLWLIQNWYVIKSSMITDNKAKSIEYLQKNFHPNLEKFGGVLGDLMPEALKGIWYEQSDLNILMDKAHMKGVYNGLGESVVAKNLQGRCKLISEKILSLFSVFNESMSTLARDKNFISKGIMDFLKHIVSDTLWLPNKMFFEAEIARLKIMFSGKIKFSQQTKIVMLIGTVIFRVLIGKVLNNPWSLFQEFPQDNALHRENLKVICSIIYHLFNHFILKSTKMDWNCMMGVAKSAQPAFLKKYLLVDLRVNAHAKMKDVPGKHADDTVGCFQVYHLYSLDNLRAMHFDAGLWENLLQGTFGVIDKLCAISNEDGDAHEVLGNMSKMFVGDLKRHNMMKRGTKISKPGQDIFKGIKV